MKLPDLTTEKMIEVDQLMIEKCRIPLIQMIKNARRNLAELTSRMLMLHFLGKLSMGYIAVGTAAVELLRPDIFTIAVRMSLQGLK